MVYKRCACPDWKNCQHGFWFALERKTVATPTHSTAPWTHQWSKSKSVGRIRLALEDYFTGKSVHGRGAYSQALRFHQSFVADVDTTGRFWSWWQQRQAPVAEITTLGQLVEQYTQHLQRQGKDLSEPSRFVWKKILEALGHSRMIDACDAKTLIPVLHTLLHHALSDSTRTTYWRHVLRVFHYAVNRDLIQDLPFQPKKIARLLGITNTSAHRDRRFHPGEETKLRGSHDATDGPRPNMPRLLEHAMDLALTLGLRKNTIRLLQFKDLNEGWSEITIAAQKMKGRRETVKPLTPEARRVFRERREIYVKLGCYGPECYIFGRTQAWKEQKPGHVRERADFLKKEWIAARSLAGLASNGRDALHFHDLRAEAACRLYEAGGYDVLAVQNFLDHRSLEQTQVYLERNIKDARARWVHTMTALEEGRPAAGDPVNTTPHPTKHPTRILAISKNNDNH